MNQPLYPLHRAAKAAGRRPLRPASQLLPLEQRFMFDGAVAGAVADAAHAAHAHDNPAALPLPPAVTVRAADPAKDGGKKEVALVDTSVAGYKSLEAGVPDGVGIVEFDGSRDGLAQIAQWAAGQSGLNAVHILSHGSEGVLNLGTDALTVASLSSATTQAELAGLGHALTPDGDLLLYGCDVAAGADGTQLLAGIAKATGADVAASTDVTGAARLGGDWTLEAHDGKIDVRALALAQYDGVLDIVSFDGSEAPYDFSDQTITKTVSGVDLTFEASEMGYDAGGIYPLDGSINGSNTRLVINIASGYSFDLTALSAIVNNTNQIITFSYVTASGTSNQVDVTVPNATVWNSIVSSQLSALNDVKQIVITSDDYISLQDFNISDVKALAPPTTSVATAHLQPGGDTGASGSDFITSIAAQTISGTLSANLASGERVQVSYDDGGSWSDATSYTVGSNAWSANTTLAGSSTFEARVTNAGGSSTAYTHTYTLDTTAPTNTVASVAFSADTGTSSSDFITRTAGQTISGMLTSNLASGDQVYVSIDNGSTWVAATDTVGSKAWSLGTTLTASSTLKVKVSDTAGNDGTPLSQAYVYDISAPTITFSGVTLSADTGASGSDFITRTTAQTITATLSGAPAGGDIVYGSLDNGGSWVNLTSMVSGSTLTWTGASLAGSGSTLLLKVTDAAGNDSTPFSHGYTVDTSAPATPGAPLLASGSDSGASNSDGITSATTPTLSGSAENGSTVTLYDGATLVGTVVAGAGGWSTATSALADGSHNITAIATDVAGNTSAASAALHITVDTSAPTVSSVTVPANGTYYGGGNVDLTVNFNEAVTVDTGGGTPSIAIVVGATTRYATYVSGSGGSALLFRYTVQNGDLDADGITVGALSTNSGSLKDTAGNNAATALNSVGSTAGVDVDGSQPSVTNVSASTPDGSYAAGTTITITVDFSGAVTVDASGATPTLALDGGGSASYTGGTGTSTLTFSYVVGAGQNSADLDYSSTAALALNGATIVDVNGSHPAASLTLPAPGSAGSLGANRDIVIDTSAPTNTITSVSFSADTGTFNNDLVTNSAAQTISGTLSANLAAGEHVYVSLDNGGSWIVATGSVGSNSWSLAGQTLTGAGTLQVKVSDAAGNGGAAVARAYVLDTTAPTIGFNNIALSADTGASNSDFITNTAAQTISATLSGAPAAGDIVYGSLDNGSHWTDITSKVSGTTLSWNGVTLTGSDTLKLRVTDAAGNDGAAASQAYVLDTSNPTNSAASVSFSNDSGPSNSDFITHTAAQTVSGTLTLALAAGDSVLVSLDNGGSWHAASATVGGTAWSLAGQTLTASDTLQVKVSDTAGNDGAVLSQAYIYTVSASTPTVDTLTSLTNLTPVLTGSATLAAGETMTVTVAGATYDVVPVAGAWTLDLSTAVPASGALALTLNHQYDVVASVTDLAGNTSNDHSTNELTLGTLVAPPPPLAPPTTGASGAALSSDSGASASDFITNVAQQNVSGSLSAPLADGESVQVSVDGGVTWQAASASGRTWSAGVTLSGSGELEVKVSNAAGDGPVYSHDYVLDTTPPAAPTVDALTAPTTTPTLTGTATLATGDTLTISVGGASYQVAVNGGSWSLDLAHATPSSGTLALTAGQHYDVSATATDLAGNTSRDTASGALQIAGAPTTLVTGAALSADSGASGSDFITNVAAQTISGSLSAPLTAGQRVEVSLDGGATWSNADAAAGAASWSISVTLSGSNVFMARVSNDAGHGAASQHAYTLDTSAPLATPTGATLSSTGVLSGGLSAPLGDGESVLVSRDNGTSWQAASISGGNWSSSGGGGGGGTVLVIVRDTAGNNGGVLSFTPDTSSQPGQPGQPGQPVPPVPPIQQVPVVTQPPAPADSTPSSPTLVLVPIDASPDTSPAAGTPLIGLPTLSGAIPSGLAPSGNPAGGVPNSPASPLFSSSAAALTEPAALLSAFTPNGLPELPFAGDALVINVPIGDQRVSAGEHISVQLGADNFASTSGNNAFQLSAQSADGTPLPGWLKFDAGAARFEGTPPPGFEGTLSFKVVARDAQGRIAVQTFKIVVTKDGQGQVQKTSSLDGHWSQPAGRSGLNEQMRTVRNDSAGAGRLAALSRSAAAAKAHA